MITEIDYSQANCFVTCPHKYYNKYIRNLKKILYDEVSVDKEFGSAVHESLAAIYLKKDDPVSVFKAKFNDLEGESLKTIDNGVFLINSYLNHYTAQNQGWEILDVEVTDSFNIGNIKYIVKIDLIIRDRNNVYVVEHKTSSAKGYFKNIFFSSFNPNTQVSGYTAYTAKRFHSCSGVIVNGLFMNSVEKPVLIEPESVQSAGYYKQQEIKYSKYYGKDMAYLSGFNCSFERQLINRYPEQIIDFESNILNIAKHIEMCQETGGWYRNESRCNDYRGCEYRDLCISCDDPQICETNYEVVNNKAYLEKDVATADDNHTKRIRND